jgi:hypothetical protein
MFRFYAFLRVGLLPRAADTAGGTIVLMACPHWVRLVESCLQAAKEYSDSLEAARDVDNPAPAALERVAEARLHVDEVEAVLRQHELQHGCWDRSESAHKHSA